MFRAGRDTLAWMTRRWSLVAVLALSLVLAACGSDPAPTDRPDTSGARTPDGPPAQSDPAPVVAEVLDFEAPLLGGGTLDGKSLAGRDVAFWFWAPW